MNFSKKERAVLKIVQADLPNSLNPYADIASEVGLKESEVITLLQNLKDKGVIRRFGASIKHQKTGWNFNAMVAWQVEPDKADEYGQIASKHRHISHCYYRPSPAPDWPYELYTMIHGRDKFECESIVSELIAQGLPANYAILNSITELKKISMSYF